MIDLDVHPNVIEHFKKGLVECQKCFHIGRLAMVETSFMAWREGSFLCLVADAECPSCRFRQQFGMNFDSEMEQEIIHKGESK